jgi:hypothetical protein
MVNKQVQSFTLVVQLGIIRAAFFISQTFLQFKEKFWLFCTTYRGLAPHGERRKY